MRAVLGGPEEAVFDVGREGRPWELGDFFKGLGVPVLDLLDGGHLVERVGEVVQFLDAVSESDRELFGEELGSAEERA